ncbi:hypothetical protein KP509_28G058300 [Ceratopteris richardii]|uniref:J domain-containing protein n=1 Tax=Ceratopteris richardii TaxID=49495 RepID=A0A8T2RE50_CERRI|nr:hypothetical protein KP509_28G058300 [Ceratopteris richardii]
MTSQFGEWPSNGSGNGRHFACQGITQQPGSFYNGNISSSVWGNPPTPPLWRDATSASSVRPSGIASEHSQSATSFRVQSPDVKEDSASRWGHSFSFGPRSTAQHSTSSPFTFGFPDPPASSFLHASNKNTEKALSSESSHAAKSIDDIGFQNTDRIGLMKDLGGSSTNCCKSNQENAKEKVYSLEDLSAKWSSILQAQSGLFSSTNGALEQSLAGDREVESDGQHHSQDGYSEPSLNSELHKTSSKDESTTEEFEINSNICLDSSKSEAESYLFRKEDVNQQTGSFRFDNCCDPGSFVFGSSSVQGTSDNVVFSHQKTCRPPPRNNSKSRSMSARARKHSISIKQSSSTAAMDKPFQQESLKNRKDDSISSNSVFRFTIGAGDPTTQSKGRGDREVSCEPASYEPPLFFPSTPSNLSNDRGYPSALNGEISQQTNSKDAKLSSNHFNVCHPFPVNQDASCMSSFKASASKYVSNCGGFAKKHDNREIRNGVPSFAETSRSFMGTKTNCGESKLTEFNLNSPGKLTAEDLPEKSAKGGKFSEDIKRQKENQEPNFNFGCQKGSRPFVFGLCRTSDTRSTGSTPDSMMKNEPTLKVTEESKVLEHLISKLEERMASLGMSCNETGEEETASGGQEEITLEHLISKLMERMTSLGMFCNKMGEQEAAYGQEECMSNDYLFNKFQKDNEEKEKAAHLYDSTSGAFEKSAVCNASIEKLIGRFTRLVKVQGLNKSFNGIASGSSSSNCRDIDENAVKDAIMGLCDRISNLGYAEGKESNCNERKCSQNEVQTRDSPSDNSILSAVEELSKQIAELGKAVRDKKDNGHSSSRLQQCDSIAQSVEELRQRIKDLGSIDVKKESCTAKSESEGDKKTQQNVFVFGDCHRASQNGIEIPYFSFGKEFINSNGSSTENVQYNPFSSGSSSTGNIQGNVFVNTPQTNLFQSKEARTFPAPNPFDLGQHSGKSDAHISTGLFSFQSSSCSDGARGDKFVGNFKFHGSEIPLKERPVQRKHGKVHPHSKSYGKSKLSGSRTSTCYTSASYSPGSPMDFSPCAVEGTSSSSGFGAFGKPSYQNSSDMQLNEAGTMNLEEIKMKISNLTVGNNKGVYESGPNIEDIRIRTSNLSVGNESAREQSGNLDPTAEELNPFSLQNKKGTWKRAPRKETNGQRFTMGQGLNSQALSRSQNSSMGFSSSDRGTSPFLYVADLNEVVKERPRQFAEQNHCSVMNENAPNGKTTNSMDFKESQKLPSISSFTRETATSSPSANSVAAEQLCEKWRLRGNQAYAKGEYQKAEDYYTRGAKSILRGEKSENCIRASMLCYSNRAATRMALGRVREALADCKQALVLDSSFIRGRLRAGSCYLALGESKSAAAVFTECSKLAKERSPCDLRLLEEAADGVRKCENLDNLFLRVSELLQSETCEDASLALQLIDKALIVSPYFDAVQEMKAQALFLHRKFEDVVQHCQETLPAAEENHGAKHQDASQEKHSINLYLWRWRMCGKAFFQLGKLDESLSYITKYKESALGLSSIGEANLESVGMLESLIFDLIRHKAAGNEAFRAGRHTEALEHYTAALSCNSDSRPFNAVCFCNRAAASQALGHVTDAIADCSRAIVLDPCYVKAISRRATLHEIIRDYGQTCNDLRRLILLLEAREAGSRSPKSAKSASKSSVELKQARDRLERAMNEMKKDCTVDHYLILGLDFSCNSSDIKKAYRKAALKHHPDKAGQFLAKGETGDDGSLWREVGDEVRRDAERLFKLIGESYAILSDPSKRAKYDLKHQNSKSGNETHQTDRKTESPYEKAGQRYHERKEFWGGYSYKYQRWQNDPDAAEPDTFSGRATAASSSSRGRGYRGGKSNFYWDDY